MPRPRGVIIGALITALDGFQTIYKKIMILPRAESGKLETGQARKSTPLVVRPVQPGAKICRWGRQIIRKDTEILLIKQRKWECVRPSWWAHAHSWLS